MSRHTLPTIITLNALAQTGLWRPAGNNDTWKEKYPFSSCMSNEEIFSSLGLVTPCHKDGIIKGEIECIENMASRGCMFDGILEVSGNHVLTEFKFGKSIRFNGNESLDVATGNFETITDYVEDMSLHPTTLGYVTQTYSPKYKGVLFVLWQINLTKVLGLLANESIDVGRGNRPIGTRFYNVPQQRWCVADENTQRSVFFLKTSERKYTVRKGIEEVTTKKYVSLRFKPSALIDWVGRRDTHTKTRALLEEHKALISTTIGVQTSTKFIINNNLKESLKKQMLWMFAEDWG
jgi:hypothetical protein